MYHRYNGNHRYNGKENRTNFHSLKQKSIKVYQNLMH